MRVAFQAKTGAAGTMTGPRTTEISLVSASGEDMLKKFGAGNRDLTQACRLVQLDWPSTRGVMVRVAEYVTDSLVLQPETGPLLFDALRHAHEVYEDCRTRQARDRERFHEFIKALFNRCATGLAPVVLEDAERGREWRARGGKPLLHWLRQVGGGNCRVIRSVDPSLQEASAVAEVHSSLWTYALTREDAAILTEVRDGR